MLKFGNYGNGGERFFKITGDLRYITWKSKFLSYHFGFRQRGKSASKMLLLCCMWYLCVVDMEKVIKVIHGQTTVPFQRVADKFGSVKKTSLSVIYMRNGKERSLNLIAPNPKAFKYWHEGLNRILKRIVYMRENATPEERFYKTKFEEADRDGSGTIDMEEAVKVIAHMNINMTRDAIAKMVVENDVDKNGTLDLHEFSNLLILLRRR